MVPIMFSMSKSAFAKDIFLGPDDSCYVWPDSMNIKGSLGQ